MSRRCGGVGLLWPYETEYMALLPDLGFFCLLISNLSSDGCWIYFSVSFFLFFFFILFLFLFFVFF